LMGLVTKNAILLVDYTNHLRRDEGLGVKDALLKAGPVRLRPIVMTTVAMVLGMTPSAFGGGDGSEFRAPISIATIGGLITSTLLTLVVVPVAYMLLERSIERIRAFRRTPLPAPLAAAVRVTTVLIVLALLGAFASAARAFG
jgi:HAE1 family hydrophobic/amphiphilic exporter-1